MPVFDNDVIEDKMKDTTRRGFLGGVGGLAASATVPARARGTGAIRVQQSVGDKRFAAAAGLDWQPVAADASQAITLDPTTTFQEILGFGAAFTEASAYLINTLAPGAREAFMHELFSPDELGINVTRVCIGSSDYATALFSYDEGAPDPTLARFSIDRDRAYVLPELLTARHINPELFMLASPWSPPGWMKNGNSMLGGNIKPPYFAVYAQYLVRFLAAYQAAGVKIDAITTQNESDTDQAGRMPAAAWPQEYEVAFVGKHLGPAIEAAGLSTKIWLLDHNFNLWGRVFNTLEDPNVFKYAEGIAWHPYVGAAESMTRIHDAYPTKSAYWTEGGFELAAGKGVIEFAATPGPMTAGAGTVEAKPKLDPMSAIVQSGLGATHALRNWVRCMIDWNVVLDETGRPNIGPFDLKGTTTIDSNTKQVTERGANYWAIKHFNHAARRGATVIQSSGDIDGLAHVAFVNTDGRKAMVLTNAGPDRTVQIRNGGRMATVALPANSLTNLSWT
jgi:glucosylceramidase